MLIKLLRNPSRDYQCDLLEGHVGAVAKDIGDKLVRDGIALEVTQEAEPPKKIRGVAAAPSIAKEIKPAIAKPKE